MLQPGTNRRYAPVQSERMSKMGEMLFRKQQRGGANAPG